MFFSKKTASLCVLGLLIGQGVAADGAIGGGNHGIPQSHPVAHHLGQAGEIAGTVIDLAGAGTEAYGLITGDKNAQAIGAGELGAGTTTGLGGYALAENTKGPVPGVLYAPNPMANDAGEVQVYSNAPQGRRLLGHHIPDCNGDLHVACKTGGGAGHVLSQVAAGVGGLIDLAGMGTEAYGLATGDR